MDRRPKTHPTSTPFLNRPAGNYRGPPRTHGVSTPDGHFLIRLRAQKLSALASQKPYVKLSDEVIEDLQFWEKLLVKARQGISINLLTIRRPDIIGWSDACPFGMGGYNTAGRAWRFLILPNSPVFGESRVNNILEYIAMTVNAIVSARDANKNFAPCVLALGDNTSAIGWLYRSSRLHKPHHSIHLKVARHLAHEIINTNCCLYSQHIAGSHNVVADLLSYDGGGHDKPHPIAYDKPNDAILTSRFHSSYATQITANFTISPLPPDIDSWLQQTMQTLESFVTDALSKPLSQPTELGDAGRGTVDNSDASADDPTLDRMSPAARHFVGKTFVQRLRYTAWDTKGAAILDRDRPRPVTIKDYPTNHRPRGNGVSGAWPAEALPRPESTQRPPSRYPAPPTLVLRTGSSDDETMPHHSQIFESSLSPIHISSR